MTLVITAIAAIIAIVVRFSRPAWAKRNSIGILALMYTGASLMWSMDLAATLMEGEAFIDFADAAATMDDAFLGAIVVILGLVIWGVINVIKSTRANRSAAQNG